MDACAGALRTAHTTASMTPVRDVAVDPPRLPQPRLVVSSRSRINCIRVRSLGLERNFAIERCIRRVQFRLALVPGTLKRYLRASKSVIMTMAIHDSHLKSVSIIAG